MKTLIAEQIMTKILLGGQVETAYSETVTEIARYLERRPASERAAAVRDLGISDPGDAAWVIDVLLNSPRDLRHVIVPGGGVSDVPDAACVARKLDGIVNPTRGDIERAFRECLEEQ